MLSATRAAAKRRHTESPEGNTMSDFDLDSHDAGASEHDSLTHTKQNQDLNQLHQNFGEDHDSLHTNEQYGHAAGYENDQNFANGHHVEYDTPAGSHFEQTDFTAASSHEAAIEQDFG